MNNHFKTFYFKKWLSRLVVLLLTIAFLSGCSATKSQYGQKFRRSQEIVTLTPSDSEKIAKYVVDLLSLNGYAVEETTFFFDRGKDNGRFGQALESQLQTSGYTLVSTDSKAQRVTYFLDELTAGAYRVDIRVEPGYQMELVYRLGNNDHLVLHSVTVRNGSSVAVSCCNMLVEVDNDMTNNSDDSEVYEQGSINIARRSVSQDDLANGSAGDLPDNSLDDYPDGPLSEESLPDQPLAAESLEEVSSANSVTPLEESKSWFVQVISLSENKPEVLATISSRIEAMGYKTYIAEVGDAKKVRVGPFESRKVVEPVLYELRSKGYSDAFLWRGASEGQGIID